LRKRWGDASGGDAPRHAAALSTDLGALADLTAAPDRREVEELRRRLEADVFRVLVVGEANRGKSTLVNALLGRSVLPTGVVPLTALPSALVHGDVDEVEVSYADGRVEVGGLDGLAVVTEDGNPHNRCGVAAVTVRVAAPLLATGLELVDTPGTGSVYEHNTAAAVTALGAMDAAILVLSADPPISAAELALLGRLRAGAVALFCVLNKVDYLSAEEVAQARTFTEREVAAELGHPVPVWPVSARHGLDARQRGDETGAAASGLAAFQAAFTGYLTACRDADLLRSVAGRAGRLADAMAEEADATLAALAVSAEDLQRRVAAFSDQLEQVRQGRAESAALAAAEIDRMLAEANEQAAALTREATGPLRHAVLTHLTGLNGPFGEVEQAALEDAAARIRNVVDDWREGRSADLDAALRALEERLSARLDKHIAAVRRTAATLFDLDLVTLLAGRPAG